MSIVLLPDELASLTGYKRPGKQCEWLKANGFKFRLNKANHPKVDRKYYESKMGLTKTGATTEPNWGNLKGVQP